MDSGFRELRFVGAREARRVSAGVGFGGWGGSPQKGFSGKLGAKFICLPSFFLGGGSFFLLKPTGGLSLPSCFWGGEVCFFLLFWAETGYSCWTWPQNETMRAADSSTPWLIKWMEESLHPWNDDSLANLGGLGEQP